jgi:hypothetical protein
MLKWFAGAILATAILVFPLQAQRRGAGAATRGTVAISPLGQGRSAGRRSGPHSYPYSYPYLDYGHDYPYDYDQAPQSQEPAPPLVAPTEAAIPQEHPVEPLLIEWQGDHFVRMTLSQKESAGEDGGPDYSEKGAPGQTQAVQPPPELPPAVLVYRDGRKEEVSDYTIMSGTIYSKADYWSSGSWTKKIQIADLDVPATLKVNQERGLKFALPAGPNEVVLRP